MSTLDDHVAYEITFAQTLVRAYQRLELHRGILRRVAAMEPVQRDLGFFSLAAARYDVYFQALANHWFRLHSI